MGRIIIEIPQNSNRNYRIDSTESAQKIIRELDEIKRLEKLDEDEDILGLWSAPEPLAKKKTA